MPLITRDNNLLTKHLTDIENTTPNILGLQNQINTINTKIAAQKIYVDTIDGDNNNDGLTPETPLKDLEAAAAKWAVDGTNLHSVCIKGSGDTTAPRTVSFVDLYPSRLSHFLFVNLCTYEDELKDVILECSYTTSSRITILSGLFNTFFDFTLTFPSTNYIQFVVYGGTCLRLCRCTINQNADVNIFGLNDGTLRFEQAAVYTNTASTMIGVNAGTIGVVSSSLTDNYATANGLAARTWTDIVSGIIRDASGTITNITSNVIK